MLHIGNLVFLSPIYLYIIPIISIIITYGIRQKYKSNYLKTNIIEDIKKVNKYHYILLYIEILIIVIINSLFLILIADPNNTNSKEDIKKNGIDIVIAMDISKSMEAQDLQPSRIEAAKSVVNKFIDKLSTDRIGLVVFAGKPYTSVPLTFDYNILKETINNITTDTLNQSVNGLDGTAIGDALLIAENIVNSTKDKENNDNREKVIILLTDGDANRGADPILVSKSFENTKIYTIGIGSLKGGAIKYNIGGFTQYQQIAPLKEAPLKEIANITNGKFFRATDNQTFNNIFDELSKLDKKDIQIKVYKEYKTNYKIFTYILLTTMIIYWGLNIIIFRD